MKKSIKFTIETQTQDNDVIAICHLNERTLPLNCLRGQKNVCIKSRPV